MRKRTRIRTVHAIVQIKRYVPTGILYNVLIDGEIVVSSRDPHTDTCRYLQARGIYGFVKFHREGSDYYHIRYDISRGAKLRVGEGSTIGFSIREWKPFPERLRT